MLVIILVFDYSDDKAATVREPEIIMYILCHVSRIHVSGVFQKDVVCEVPLLLDPSFL